MISNKDKIVVAPTLSAQAFNFCYADKYTWSILALDSKGPKRDYVLYFYPGLTQKDEVYRLINRTEDEWDRANIVKYATYLIKTKEATESFAELFQILQGKATNMDQVLDDIIAIGWGDEG